MKNLILASQSPRRQSLLKQLGYQFSIVAADIDESVLPHESPSDYVLRLAQQKAQAIFAQLSHQQQQENMVLGADTSVVIGNTILGKPDDYQQCLATLQQLSGNIHQVLTSIAVVSNQGSVSEVISTEVSFKTLTENEISRYWQTKEPCDKAGSYAIQGIGGQFVKKIEGSYSAVVGLPLYETSQMLAKLGLVGSL